MSMCDAVRPRSPVGPRSTRQQVNAVFERDFGFRRALWWTGTAPVYGECPGVGESGVIASLPPPNTATCTRADMLNYLDNTWTLTEVLFSGLKGESAFHQLPPHRLRHPLLFYYLHTAVFYVNKLRAAGLITSPVHQEFETRFAVGVDEMRWDDMIGEAETWPSVCAVRDYRRRIHPLVRHLIQTHTSLAPGHAPVTPDDPLWSLWMALEHERVHLETSSVLIRELPVDLVARPPEWPAIAHAAMQPHESDFQNPSFIEVRGATVELGKSRDLPSFGWDNEYGSRRTDVHTFRASRTLVTHAAYLEFVRSGGYEERGHWGKEGWRWRCGRTARFPAFWVDAPSTAQHSYRLRTCFEEIDLPPLWPAEVNQYEAKAYCAWITCRDRPSTPFRLPTEAEHWAMRSPTPTAFASTAAETSATPVRDENIQLRYGSPSPVDASPPNKNGFHDLFGNVWERCEDDFNPLPGFAVHPLYKDFSTPCFDGAHHMIMGGSFASTGDLASRFARYHFRPHIQQHAGFRIAQNVDPAQINAPVRIFPPDEPQSKYDTDACLASYLQLHHGRDEDSMPFPSGPEAATQFPKRVARLALNAVRRNGTPLQRALDLGCAVGGTAFELAQAFARVDAVDRSAQFISVSKRLQQGESIGFELLEEGSIRTRREAAIHPARLHDNVAFHVADACTLPSSLRCFDLVVMANLLCRLGDPKACLAQLTGSEAIVQRGGIVVITAPYSWNREFTPPHLWLGGFERHGEACWSFDQLEDQLGREYHLVEREDMPLLIREHRRKYEYVMADATVWRKI